MVLGPSGSEICKVYKERCQHGQQGTRAYGTFY